MHVLSRVKKQLIQTKSVKKQKTKNRWGLIKGLKEETDSAL